MSLFARMSTFALRQVAEGACAAVGIGASGEAVAGFLTDRFTDQSQRLNQALQDANDRAWKALEIALAGDSFWDRCKGAGSGREDRAFAQQVRAFLDATPLPELAGKDPFRQKCLQELRAARTNRMLAAAALEPRRLAQQTADFARFADPKSRLDAEWRVVVGMAGELKDAGCPSLGWLLAQRPQHGTPLLVVAVRYFFRRCVEEDQKLFQGLAFAKLDALSEAQEKGFAALTAALAAQGQRLEELLGDVKAVVVQTHSAVLDLRGQMQGQREQIQQMGQAVMKLLEQHQLHGRELRPADSMSIRNDGERKLVKQLVERYRALPPGERQKLPALLNAVGKLEVVSGNFEAAQKDFQHVATLVAEPAAQAEAHFNAYRTALERRDWTTALKELLQAVKLDARRFAPFPAGKYHPQRVLGAGGFGVAFACRHKELKADVVVKTLTGDDLERDVDEVFNEARVLYQLEHPAIIRLLDCGYTIPSEKARPYFVMNFFESVTLEEYVQTHGPLAVQDLAAVARQLAEGLQAAHGKGILHRDVKPANILVRLDDAGWQVKVIDFGLAFKHRAIEGAASTARSRGTLVGSSIAGTLDYAAPEQMGRSPGVAVGPYSDVYGWAKTCCFGLFKTTQPLPKHWQSIPPALARLLEQCLAEPPQDRPANFTTVLGALAGVEAPPVPKKAGPRGGGKVPWKTLTGVGVALLMSLLGLVCLGLWAGGVFRVRTPDGVLLVEVNEPNPDVFVDGSQVTVTWANGGKKAEIRVKPGTHKVEVSKDGFTMVGEDVEVKDGDRRVFAARLEPAVAAPPMKKGDVPPAPATGTGGKVYLSDLPEFDWQGLKAGFFKNGEGYVPGGIRVNGERSPKGLWTHPPSKGYSTVKYRLAGLDAQAFAARVALNDTVKVAASPLTFEVLGDDQVLWSSKPVQAAGQTQDCSVNVHGIQVLELRVLCPGLQISAHAVWLDPYLVTTAKTAKPRIDPPSDPPPTPVVPANDPLVLDLGGGITVPFVRVPRGTFWMGWTSDKKMSRLATIDTDFELGVYPVTQNQWQAVMQENPSEFSRFGKGKDRVANISNADLKLFPVESVSWHDAQAFLRKLNAREDGKGWLYRLPREAEWEYACRNAATTKAECSFDFYFDQGTNDLSSNQANFNGNFPAGNAGKGPFLERTTKVGSYPPNKLGLYDMQGNVWQWCEDAWNDKKGPGRVRRGPSWLGRGDQLRVGIRTRIPPANHHNDLGLRLARVPSAGK